MKDFLGLLVYLVYTLIGLAVPILVIWALIKFIWG